MKLIFIAIAALSLTACFGFAGQAPANRPNVGQAPDSVKNECYFEVQKALAGRSQNSLWPEISLMDACLAAKGY